MIDILFGLAGAFCIAFGLLYFASIILNTQQFTIKTAESPQTLVVG